MCTYFKIETDVAENLIDDFFSNFDCQRILPQKGFYVKKKYAGTGLISEETDVLYAELNKRAKTATSSYSTTGDFLKCICSVLVAKNHQRYGSRCLVHEFSFTDTS